MNKGTKLAAGLAMATAMVLAVPAAAQIQFTEVSSTAGVDGDLYVGISFHALGMNWIDVNNDGWHDLFVVNGANLDAHLFLNDQDGTFTRRDDLIPALPNVEMMGSVFGDIDNDGDDDIYIFADSIDVNDTTAPPNLLLLNQFVENGNALSVPLFVEGAAAANAEDLTPDPLDDPPAFSIATGQILDYDRDGYLDLFMCPFERGITNGNPINQHRLYHNLGDGTYEDASFTGGVAGTFETLPRPCLAMISAHLDDDFWPDMYVGNIVQPLPYQLDHIFENQRDGTFLNQIVLSPFVGDESGAAMGIDAADHDHDGDLDVYITDLGFAGHDVGGTPGGNPFYEGSGNGIVIEDDSAAAAGVIGRQSWGTNFFDVDHDSFEEIFVSTMGTDEILYQNNGNGTFTDISMAAGFNTPAQSRGSAVADYDHDGDLDLAVVADTDQLFLYRNDTVTSNHWLQFDLHGAGAGGSNTTAIGAVVKIEVGGVTLRDEVKGGVSGHGQDAPTLHFGLGAATQADEVYIFWPSGHVDHWSNQAADVIVSVSEDLTGPRVTAPSPGSVLTGANETFDWTADGETVTDWQLQIGTSVGANDIFDSGVLAGGTLSVGATGLPTDGTVMFARLHYTVGGSPEYADFEYTGQQGNDAAVITITAPIHDTSHTAGSLITFTATAIDTEDGDISANLQWYATFDGMIGTGGSFTAALTEERQQISAIVTDSGGRMSGKFVVIDVVAGGNTPPTVSITAPPDGHTVSSGTSINFTGTANDVEDGDITGMLTWTSDLDGVIGGGGSFSTTTLSVGTHLITASATDSGGLTGSDQINVTVTAGGNNVPTVTITGPPDGHTVVDGTSIDFTGTANDIEDGDITANLAWTSDLDGAIGNGGSFSATLSVGTHTVTASVTDSGGLSGFDSIQVIVNSGGGGTTDVTFTSIGADDGMIAESNEDSDVGGQVNSTAGNRGALRVGDFPSDAQIKSVVSFDTSAIPPGSTIVSADLRLKRGAELGTNPWGTHGPCTADIQTGGINSNVALEPADFQAAMTAIGVATMSTPAADGDWSEGSLDPTGIAAINISGITQFRIACALDDNDNGIHDALGFHSGDDGNADNHPQLLVSYVVGDAPPVVTITSPADGSAFSPGVSINFTGTAIDFEDGDISASLDWTSDLDGSIGSGASFSTTLSVGTHVITAEVTDSGGSTVSDMVTVTVGNMAPVVTITSPADGSAHDEGTLVSFTGTANDAEDGDLTASLSWSSSLDGVIGAGGSFSIDTLSLGTHDITAEVTDSGTLMGSDTISITIVPVGGSTEVTLTSIAADDGMISETSEDSETGGQVNSTSGNRGAMRVGDFPNDAQLKVVVSFDTSAIPGGSTILSANLRLRRGAEFGTNPFGTHGPCTADVQTGGISGNVALEPADFQAAMTATGVATMSNPLANGDWSEGNLDAAGLAAINIGGTTQFRIQCALDDNDDGGQDALSFHSGNDSNADNHPQLVVTYQ